MTDEIFHNGRGFEFKPQGDTDLARQAHLRDDVDFDRASHHHTLGKGPTQAAPGNDDRLHVTTFLDVLPLNPKAGDTNYAPTKREFKTFDGSAWVTIRHEKSATYAVVMSNSAGGFVLGNSTLEGVFHDDGDWVDVTIVWIVGSTTSGGTAGGAYEWTLPFTAVNARSFFPVGQTVIHDVGAQAQGFLTHLQGTTKIRAADDDNIGGAVLGPTVPFALNTGDEIVTQLRYRRVLT